MPTFAAASAARHLLGALKRVTRRFAPRRAPVPLDGHVLRDIGLHDADPAALRRLGLCRQPAADPRLPQR
jgi:hypothetical protein